MLLAELLPEEALLEELLSSFELLADSEAASLEDTSSDRAFSSSSAESGSAESGSSSGTLSAALSDSGALSALELEVSSGSSQIISSFDSLLDTGTGARSAITAMIPTARMATAITIPAMSFLFERFCIFFLPLFDDVPCMNCAEQFKHTIPTR